MSKNSVPEATINENEAALSLRVYTCVIQVWQSVSPQALPAASQSPIVGGEGNGEYNWVTQSQVLQTLINTQVYERAELMDRLKHESSARAKAEATKKIHGSAFNVSTTRMCRISMPELLGATGDRSTVH